ncbi:MAG: OsmC family protein [Candidatus Ranarchaeia archaeon]
MSEEERVTTTILEQVSDYEFRVKFDLDEVEDIIMDEPKPLGGSKGTTASRALAAAVSHCMSASFIFCMRKREVPLTSLKTVAKSYMRRNEKGRWRIHHIDITVHPKYEDPTHHRIARCVEIFEDYCIVTQSVRKGIPINIKVEP